jgi:hypothetical protein
MIKRRIGSTERGREQLVAAGWVRLGKERLDTGWAHRDVVFWLDPADNEKVSEREALRILRGRNQEAKEARR